MKNIKLNTYDMNRFYFLLIIELENKLSTVLNIRNTVLENHIIFNFKSYLFEDIKIALLND